MYKMKSNSVNTSHISTEVIKPPILWLARLYCVHCSSESLVSIHFNTLSCNVSLLNMFLHFSSINTYFYLKVWSSYPFLFFIFFFSKCLSDSSILNPEGWLSASSTPLWYWPGRTVILQRWYRSTPDNFVAMIFSFVRRISSPSPRPLLSIETACIFRG